MNKQQNAKCTLSDSGTISEESAMLGFPAISLRQSMERPEAQDTGSIILTGFEPEIVLSSVRTVIEEYKNINSTQRTQIGQINTDKNSENQYNLSHLRSIPQDYTITNTSWRVLKLMLGNTGLSNKWWGINKPAWRSDR